MCRGDGACRDSPAGLDTGTTAHTLSPGCAGSLAKFSQGVPAARKLQLLRTGSTCTGEQKCSPLGSAHCSAELQLPPGVFSPGCLMPLSLPYFSFSNKQHSLGDALKRWTPFKLWIKPNGVPTHALTCLIKAHFTWWLPVYNFFFNRN